MSSTAAAVYKLAKGQLDVVMITAETDEALLKEARHQGYLKRATAIALTFAPSGERRVHYRRNEEDKFVEVDL